jgi:hypothetical protein
MVMVLFVSRPVGAWQAAGVGGRYADEQSGIGVALADLGVPFVRAKVGDRYVITGCYRATGSGVKLRPPSVFQHTTGDTIIAALQVLIALKREQTLE